MKQKLNGRGVYVYIEKSGGKITVMQDFAGSYGLYMYNHDGRFVLSNSFLRLSEYLRTRVRLTLNRDYANYFMMMGLASMSFSRTLLNEVEVLPRNTIINIDISSRKYELEYIDYRENSVSLNSQEGMDILDRWFARWSNFFRGLRSVTSDIEADLSGGMDSRMVFVPFSKSGIDLNHVCVRCLQGKRYTFEQDYKIASQIAESMGFKLNNEEGFTGGRLNFSADDSLKIPFFAKMQVHNQMHHKAIRYEHTHFKITGGAGETVRERHWDPSSPKFIDSMCGDVQAFSGALRQELLTSGRKILQETIEAVSRKTGLPISEEIASAFYRETWMRFHFGCEAVESFIANEYKISPLMDWELHKLKRNDSECRDNNLLMAVLYERYCPELLKFSFTKNESVNDSTREFARKLNAKFPIKAIPHAEMEFFVKVKDSEVSRLLERNNPALESGTAQKYIKQVFDSTALRKLFVTQFDEEIYLHAEEYFGRTNWYGIARCHQVVAIAKIIKDVLISEGTCGGLTDDLQSFVEPKISSTSSDHFTIAVLQMKRFLRIKVIRFPRKAAGKILRMLKLKK